MVVIIVFDAFSHASDAKTRIFIARVDWIDKAFQKHSEDLRQNGHGFYMMRIYEDKNRFFL